MLRPALEYPLSTTTRSKWQIETYHRSIVQAVLGALGINRRFPRVVAHCPSGLLGIGLSHPCTVQGVKQVVEMIRAMQQENENGKIYTIVIDSAQLLAGTSKHILELPSIAIPHLTDPYLVSIRTFLAETDLSIVTPKTMRITPPRINDSALMDKGLAKFEKSPKKIREFNQCQLYLRGIYLSDLTNGAGTELHSDALTSRYQNRAGQTRWAFPRQEMPPDKS